ncbi:NAD(P)H dehydrogenase [Pseudomonas aeruginosa]|nr:NAD(P)H dehydrogenase [Pseudomonas aeruginosa]
MNVLIVYAHPEPRSLNGALKDFAVARLEAAGHAVQVSDLYAMGWKAVLDAGDSLEREASERFDPSATSLRAFENGWQSVDIAGEQDKLRWADTLILQFPLWWFSMPAILKGWIDRVYACGFAYGVGEHSDSHWGDRYGEGRMQGKRAMLVVTAGGWESALRRARYQRTDGRPAVPHPSRHPALPRLRGIAAVRRLSQRPDRRGAFRRAERAVGPAPR